MTTIMLKKIAKTVVSIIFVSISFLKMSSFEQFTLNVQNYNIIPYGLIAPVSILIIVFEFLGGIGLFVKSFEKPSSLLLISLLTVFSIAIIISLLDNNINNCGCFGNYVEDKISWWSVVRNVIFIVVLISTYQTKQLS